MLYFKDSCILDSYIVNILTRIFKECLIRKYGAYMAYIFIYLK